jgi:hypothetical protein
MTPKLSDAIAKLSAARRKLENASAFLHSFGVGTDNDTFERAFRLEAEAQSELNRAVLDVCIAAGEIEVRQ